MSYQPPFRAGVHPLANAIRPVVKYTDPSQVQRADRGAEPKTPFANLRGGQVRSGPKNPEPRVDAREVVAQAKNAFGWCAEDFARELPENSPVRKEFDRQQAEERKAFEAKYGSPVASKK